MTKRQTRRPTADAEGILPFRIDPDPLRTPIVSFSGLPLIAEAFRGLGLQASCRRHLALKQRERGFSEAQMIESFALMLAAGGECLDDFNRLREEQGLPMLLGYQAASPDAARRFLYAFHDDAILAKRPADAAAWIPPESKPLRGLARINQDLVTHTAAALPTPLVRTATLDHDATIIESHNRAALPHYKGGRGYQPSLIVWAETDLVVADEFRDGNVPAGTWNRQLIQQAFDALPNTVRNRFFRADSACYEHEVLRYLRREQIGFAISADLSESLVKHIKALPENAWKPLDGDREWAEVLFVPGDALFEPASVQPDRYLAIRWKPRQLSLWEADGYRYFAIVTNLPWKGPKLIDWHRQKAGTIEHVHRVLKDELGLGVMPCARFGADAAWTRLNVITYNLMTVVRTLALPKDLRRARPKRLRFEILQLAGIVIRHARCVIVRLGCSAKRIRTLIEARYQLAGLALSGSG
jgi:hypothetical protein